MTGIQKKKKDPKKKEKEVQEKNIMKWEFKIPNEYDELELNNDSDAYHIKHTIEVEKLSESKLNQVLYGKCKIEW